MSDETHQPGPRYDLAEYLLNYAAAEEESRDSRAGVV